MFPFTTFSIYNLLILRTFWVSECCNTLFHFCLVQYIVVFLINSKVWLFLIVHIMYNYYITYSYYNSSYELINSSYRI